MASGIDKGTPLAGQPFMISQANNNAARDTLDRPEFQESIAPFLTVGALVVRIVNRIVLLTGRPLPFPEPIL
jgi:hypothetical protein